jgi:hypothetical protein
LKHKNPVPGDLCQSHLHFQYWHQNYAVNMGDLRLESSAFHNHKRAKKNEQNRQRAIQIAGSAVEISLGLALIFLVLSFIPATAARS